MERDEKCLSNYVGLLPFSALFVAIEVQVSLHPTHVRWRIDVLEEVCVARLFLFPAYTAFLVFNFFFDLGGCDSRLNPFEEEGNDTTQPRKLFFLYFHIYFLS